MQGKDKISEEELSFLKKYYKSNFDKKSQLRLIDLILQYQNDAKLKNMLQLMMENTNSDGVDDEFDAAKNLNKLHHKINLQEKIQRSYRRSKFIRFYQRAAAILIVPLLIASLAFGYYASRGNSFGLENAVVNLNAASGAKTSFVLPDGTKGWLNSNSTLSYSLNFRGGRKVTLVGEAFFDVVHNKKDPFYVSTEALEVKVLGTKFDVVNYPNEENVQVILEDGSVECSINTTGAKKILKPNQLLNFSRLNGKVTYKNVTASYYTSWKEGLLILREESLAGLISKLNRWHDVEIVVMSDELMDYSFWGVFNNERLESILDLLKITSPIKYEVVSRELQPDNTFSKKQIKLFYDEEWQPDTSSLNK